MREIKAVHATPENFGRFGVVERLTDKESFQGDGWECWMTDDAFMDASHFGMTIVKTWPPYEVATMERHTKTRELMVSAGDKPIVVALADSDPSGLAKAEDIEAFYIEPGEALVINKGIWHDACRGLDGEALYYFLSLETDEPAVFQPVEGGPVKVVL